MGRPSFLAILSLLPTLAHADNPCGSAPPPDLANLGSLSKAAEQCQVLLAAKLDPAKLRAWNPSSPLPCPPPFRATFRKGGRELRFFAVDHLSEPTPVDAGEPAILRRELEAFRPQALLIESWAVGRYSPGSLDRMREGCLRDGKFVCGESQYAATVAGPLGGEVFGGEPPTPELMSALEKTLPADSRRAYLATMALLNLQRSGLPPAAWEGKFAEEAAKLAGGREAWTYAAYSDWLKREMKAEPKDLRAEWIEPRPDGSSLQKIAARVDEIREPIIQRHLEENLNRGARTAVVYGFGHYYKQAAALIAALGAPAIECLAAAQPPKRSTSQPAQ